MANRRKSPRLMAPFLRSLRLKPDSLGQSDEYPLNLPWLDEEDFRLTFESPVTIIIGENGTGKSTLIEGIAALCGYDEAGGGKGYRSVDHDQAVEKNGGDLAQAMVAGWLPKVTDGWFFRAESFFSVARYLDEAALEVGQAAPDYLSHSHGEGFIRLFQERMARRGLYLMDEPESALSPARQIELLKVLARIQASQEGQVIMATHSPLLMALPGAQLFEVTRFGIDTVEYRKTRHFQLYKRFIQDPEGFMAATLDTEGAQEVTHV